MYRKVLFIFIFLSFALSASSVEEHIIPSVKDSESPGGQKNSPEGVYPVRNSGLSKDEDIVSGGVYLTLEEVCQLALNNNFDIQLAQFDAQFKQTDLDSARSVYDTLIEVGTNFKDDRKKTVSSLTGTSQEARNYNFAVSQKLPTGTTLGAGFNHQRSWTDSAYVAVNPAHDAQAELTLKQELGRNFFGIQDRSKIKISKIDIENAQYTSLDKIEQTLSEVQKTYWKIAQYLNLLGIRQDMLLEAKQLFQINQEKLKKGIIEKPQLLASEANLRQKEIDLILVKNELQFHINELRLLLNLDNLDEIVLPAQSLDFTGQQIELSQSLKSAFQYRRDYFLAENEIKAKKIKLVMQKNNLWPEINLEASVTRNGLDNHFSQAIQDISSEDNPEYFLGLKIKFPLQNRQAKSEFNKAKIEQAKALLELKKIERQILVEIKDGVRNCQVLEQRALKQNNVVRLQEEKLAAELKAYQYGRSDTDTVIRYQDDLLSSKILYAQALFDYKQSLIELALKENILLGHFWKDEL
ncbi:MAG: TolC family protein [Candidatus Omnitrophota bacterium]|jgi:outer membrane protein TolC